MQQLMKGQAVATKAPLGADESLRTVAVSLNRKIDELVVIMLARMLD